MASPLSFPRSVTGQVWAWRGAAGDCDDLVNQILLARGCPPESLPAYRNPTIRDFMPDPSIFRDMDKAADRLARAVRSGEKVTIFGDYDVDGVSGTAILVKFLSEIGCTVSYRLPHRVHDGYGLKKYFFDELSQK